MTESGIPIGSTHAGESVTAGNELPPGSNPTQGTVLTSNNNTAPALPVVEHPTTKDQWLRSTYLHAERPNTLTIEEFSKITTTSDADSFWQDSQVQWALELIRRRYEGLRDVKIMSPYVSGLLWAVGAGVKPIPDRNSTVRGARQELEETYRPMATELRESSIVILPVSDGIRANYPTETTEKGDGTKPPEDPPKSNKASKPSENPLKNDKESEPPKEPLESNKGSKPSNDLLESDEESELSEEPLESDKESEPSGNTTKPKGPVGSNKGSKPSGDTKKPTDGRKKVQDQPGYRPDLGRGAHWSFIVVDMRNEEHPTARYVDGMVSPRRIGNGRWRIDGININGAVAGEVLRGFENCLGLERGSFAARTLKFVPHMSRANAFRGDHGPCGPHLYAFLDHILAHKTTLIDPDLQTTYNNEATRATRATELGFDSRATRRRVAEELQEERRNLEAQHPERSVANLTPEVLRSLMTVGELIKLARSAVASSPFAHSSYGGLDDSLAGNGGDDDKNGEFGDPPVPKIFLLEEIKANPDTYKGITSDNDRYAIAHAALIERQKIAENKGAAPAKIATSNGLNTTEVFVGKYLYRNVPLGDRVIWPALQKNITFPGGFSIMPDFAAISQSSLKRWVNTYADIQKLVSFKEDGWEAAASALLHLKIYKTFLNQSDKKLEGFWIKDRAVFDPESQEVKLVKEEIKSQKTDRRSTYGVLREMLMRHYMGDKTVDALLKVLEKYKVKEPTSGKKRKSNDDDDDEPGSDDSEDGGPGNNGGKGKRIRRRKDKSSGPNGSVNRKGRSNRGNRAAPGASGGQDVSSEFGVHNTGGESSHGDGATVGNGDKAETDVDTNATATAASLPTGNASDAQGNSGAPEKDSDSSSALDWLSESPEWPSSSDKESVTSKHSDPESGSSFVNKNKRPHDSTDDESKHDGKPNKRPRTEAEPSRPVISADTGSTSGHGNAGGQPVVDEPGPAYTVNASFDSQATVEDETIEVYIGRQPYILDPTDTSIFLPFDTTRAGSPSHLTELPDFAHLSASVVYQWRSELPNPNPTFSNYTHCLAILHMHLKRTFMHEPDANFSEVWIRDNNVFDVALRGSLRAIPDPRVRNGEIRRRMMEVYEPDMLRRVEALPKPTLANPKITVQRATFDAPESFDEHVHPGDVQLGRRRKESVDETRLSPRAAGVSNARARFGLRGEPKPSKKRSEG